MSLLDGVMADPAMDLLLTITHEQLYRDNDLPAEEPCESCGTPIRCVDVANLVHEVTGQRHPLTVGTNRPSRRRWLESCTDHQLHTLRLRPHSPDRCRAVRAGQPEPWPAPDTDDEDL